MAAALSASAFSGGVAPKGLYTRALIIIIAPIVILQTILTFVFLDRHYKAVTGRLAVATAQDIAMLADIYEGNKNKGPAEARRLAKMAEERLHLQVYFDPPDDLPVSRSKPFFDPVDKHLSNDIRQLVRGLSGSTRWDSHGRIQILVKLDGALMRVYAQRAQFLPSNTHFFLVWMVVSATVLLIVAILFLRNQIRPILSLADAADRFGRGRRRWPVSKSAAPARCGLRRRPFSKCATASSAMSSSARSCLQASATTCARC